MGAGTAAVGVDILLDSGGCHTLQIAVLVIVQSLRHLPHQGEIVEARRVAVSFIGSRNADLLHRFFRLLRHHCKTCELPARHIRVEGRIK